MINKVEKMAKMITSYIDGIIEDNTDKSFINEAEFEFGDKNDSYKTKEFKDILDNHFKEKNVTYRFKEIRPHVVYFKVKLHDWIRE
ncbi:hypothetical protein PN398_07920 [Romboutsia sp. 1001216sp1]|uniref:hypothetical protein n=1 Tax=unclassified Romboutsia TaxID=2626894 RepID=UPI00189F2486|nr:MULTISPECIES: hypothetical protein [unclassified Romboutsia]MDB8790645.1 hypothetical protein [Romboutsia sp. 1001216sp1]MDB8803264.1 hypothetical protein [Romboutsia sp. 1001216sp1]MDB8814628.1 hypothetical protein [Romboutsia sp. 1001216sp1]